MIRNTIFFMSKIALFNTLIFASTAYADNVIIDEKNASKLPIHAYENRLSVANVIAIIGGHMYRTIYGIGHSMKEY